MRTVFHRLTPLSKHMVTEAVDDRTLALLCAECGWEGTATVPDAPWPVFMNHPCRLSHTMLSEGF